MTYYIESLDTVVPESDTEVVLVDVTTKVRGEEVTVTNVAERRYQKTGEVVFDQKLDDERLEAVYRAYAKVHHLVYQDEIKLIRHKIGISQRGFATLLGLSRASIEQYETGSLPTTSASRRIAMLRNVNAFIIDQLFAVSDQTVYSRQDLRVLMQWHNQVQLAVERVRPVRHADKIDFDFEMPASMLPHGAETTFEVKTDGNQIILRPIQ